MKYFAGILGRDWVELEEIGAESIHLKAKGCLSFLRKVENLREQLSSTNYLEALKQYRNATSHGDYIIIELLQKASQTYVLPYKEEELCHCRAVPTELVLDCIQAGARDLNSVGVESSAGTSCGSCKPDIESCLSFILQNS